MSEQSQENGVLPPAPAENDMLALIKKMQQQLVFLEKKIDILINQSKERPFKEGRFSKPFHRSFDHRPHRFDREKDHASGEKSFPHGRHFEKRPNEENRGFSPKKKSYDRARGSDFGQDRHSEKHQGDEHRGYGYKKKTFFHKHRDRE